MAIDAARLRVVVGAETSQAERGLSSFSSKLESVAQRAGRAGSIMSLGITAPIVALGTVAFKSGVDFESAFAGVRKTVEATEEEFARLESGIRSMALEIPVSAVEISGIAEAAGQLGIQTDAILDFSRVMADLGVATNLTGEQAATALARFANITQMPQDQFDNLGSTIVALGNNLATTESEIVEMGLRIAAAGSQVGLTEAQILSFAGALSSVGIAAEAGGTAFSRVMIDMATAVETNSEKLALFAEVANMTSAQFSTMFQEDAAGAIIAFVEGLGEMSAAGENVFGVLEELGLSEVRVRDALLRAAGASDVFTEALQIGTQAWEKNTALSNEAAQRYATTASQLQILANHAREFGIALFTHIQPGLQAGLQGISGFVSELTTMASTLSATNPALVNAGLAFAGVLAAAGPALLAISGIAAALGFLISPLGAVTVGVAALAAAWAGNFAGMREAVNSVLAPLQELATATQITWTPNFKKVAVGELIDFASFSNQLQTAMQIDIGKVVTGKLDLKSHLKTVAINIKDIVNFQGTLTPAGLITVQVNENQFEFDIAAVITEIQTQATAVRTALQNAYAAEGWSGVVTTIGAAAAQSFSLLWTEIQLGIVNASASAQASIAAIDWSTTFAELPTKISAFFESEQWTTALDTVQTKMQPLATKIGDFFTSADWTNAIADTGFGILQWRNELLAGLTNAIETFDWGAVTTSFSAFVRDIVTNITGALTGEDALKALEDTGGIFADLGGAIIAGLTDALSAPDFGKNVGEATGQAAGALTTMALSLVEGLTAEIGNIKWAEFDASIDTFVTGFIEGLVAGLGEANFTPVAEAIMDNILEALGLTPGEFGKREAENLGLPTDVPMDAEPRSVKEILDDIKSSLGEGLINVVSSGIGFAMENLPMPGGSVRGMPTLSIGGIGAQGGVQTIPVEPVPTKSLQEVFGGVDGEPRVEVVGEISSVEPPKEMSDAAKQASVQLTGSFIDWINSGAAEQQPPIPGKIEVIEIEVPPYVDPVQVEAEVTSLTPAAGTELGAETNLAGADAFASAVDSLNSFSFTWPEFPEFIWPPLPAWTWPEYPQWVWPKIERPSWLSELKFPRPDWIGEILSWSPVVRIAQEGAASPQPQAPLPQPNALGTPFWKGGLTLVGEQGAEIVNLPRGSQIFSNQESMAMLAAASGPQVVINASVRNDLDIELLARRIQEMIRQRGR